MRSAIVAAAFAIGALAIPLKERDVVYETDIVYATEYVTVTAGDAAPTDAPAPSSSSSSSHYGHKKGKNGWTRTYAWTSTFAETAAPSSAEEQAPAYSSVEEQAPAYTAPAAYTSVEEEQPAPTSEAPQSTYEEPSPTTSQAASSQAPASGAKPSDYQSFATFHHNVHRANHSAPDLTWNDTLAATAEKIGNLCSYEHMMTMDGGGYGQNIAAGVKGDNVSAVITELFYNGEERAYADAGNYGKSGNAFDNSNFHVWGHMTQIVWTNTTSVGCATVDCSAGGLAKVDGNVAPFFTVCNYYPPGNYENEYANSVLAPRGDATCHWDDGQ